MESMMGIRSYEDFKGFRVNASDTRYLLKFDEEAARVLRLNMESETAGPWAVSDMFRKESE